jgi:hypothetical protein
MNLYQPTITGSLKISGSVEITGSLIGSAVTASYATNLTVSGTITAQTLVVQTVTSSVIYSSGSNVFGNDITNTQVMTGSLLMTGSLNITGGNQVIRSNTNQVLLLSSSFSTGLYTSYQSGSTVIGDIGNGSQVFSAGDVTAFGINARDTRKLQLGAAQTVVMTISGNNVGIGNTSPSFPLEVSNTSSGLIARFTSNQNEAQIRLVNTSTGGRTYSLGSGGTSSGGARGFYIYDETGTFTAFTITGSGNVGISTSTPAHKLDVSGDRIRVKSTGAYGGFIADNTGGTGGGFFAAYKNNVATGYFGTSGAILGDTSEDIILYGDGSASIRMYTANIDRMRILNAGDVCINTTSAASSYAWLHVRGASKGIAIQSSVDNNYRAIYSTSNILYFWNGSNEGGLNASGVWFDASDVTIKKDIEDIKYGLNEVLQLKPRSYKMIEDNSDQIGFIAQEIEEVLPELVSTSERGMKGLSYGQITAVLAKAIQELKADNDAIRAELAALKS